MELPAFNSEFQSEIQIIDDTIELDHHFDNISEVALAIPCQKHPLSFLHYVCTNPNCVFIRYLCQKCVKETLHFDEHKSFMINYETYFHEKYSELNQIHSKLKNFIFQLELDEKKNIDRKEIKAKKRKKFEFIKKSDILFKELKNTIKNQFQIFITELFNDCVKQHVRLLKNTIEEIKSLEDLFNEIRELFQDLIEFLGQELNAESLEKLIEIIPVISNETLKKIAENLNKIKNKINNFNSFENDEQNLKTQEFINRCSKIIIEKINEYLSKFQNFNEIRINKKNYFRVYKGNNSIFKKKIN